MERAVFLQSRLSSTRLNRKALIEIAGKTLVEHALCSLKKIPADVHCLVCPEEDVKTLAPLAEAEGCEIYGGSKEDVLDRFVQVGRRFQAKWIVRATGDNPLVSWEKATELLEILEREDADYGHIKGLILGCGVEVFKRSALEEAWEKAEKSYDREHVTPYIYFNPDRFKLHFPTEDRGVGHARLTVDLEEDLQVVQEVFDKLYTGEPIPYELLVEHLLTDD